jgi:hypothetical protein
MLHDRGGRLLRAVTRFRATVDRTPKGAARRLLLLEAKIDRLIKRLFCIFLQSG